MIDGPEPPPPEPATERDLDQPRLHFHIALAGILVPCAAPFLTWTLALLNLAKRNAHPRHRLWTNRLVALGLADVIVCLSVLALAAQQKQGFTPAAPPPLKIGVVFETDTEHPTRALDVIPGSPAEDGGLLIGDRIVEIDGRPVASLEEIQEELRAGAEGDERILSVLREGRSRSLAVLPARTFSATHVGLFEPRPGRRPFSESARDYIDVIPPAAVILFALIYSLVRKARALGTWVAFLLVMTGTYGGIALLSRMADGAAGGLSLGMVLLLLNAQMILLLGLSGIATRALRKTPKVTCDPEPPMKPLKTFLLAVLYFIGGGPRLIVPLVVASGFLFEGAGAPRQPLEEIASAPLGVLGVVLFILPTVILGPIAEEVVFRGFLLPRLAAQISARWGLWISGILFGLLHLHYMILVPVVIYYGMLFGWARMRSGTLLVPVLLHMAVNALATTVYLLR